MHQLTYVTGAVHRHHRVLNHIFHPVWGEVCLHAFILTLVLSSANTIKTVLSRSAFQFDTSEQVRDEIPFPFPPANPSSRASTPKNIRGSTPKQSSSPRRSAYSDPPPQLHHHPLQSSMRSPSPSSSSHDHLIVTPLRGSSKNT